ncbi:uncharacterized protein SAMN02745248_01566 [Hathewaya proteolytica DSM 3090]|uniref:Uncharacterized protein n=1 Tax=Hathewaya proteolytica DSM 3090 TaxID=1121331 RepID=A0A1M6NZC3_9CLOT|nr:ATP-dependent sacrificial sulfur transferase LarE [Hathewaya proteolytica]SHK01021.1 uncharacterized protein SAMN02745248_01566 [Hathewaya proteolytica DSM 3090]
MDLKEFFKNNNKVALGFSGGVDSSYLLYAALKYGADVCPYYVKTAFQPQFEFEDALKLAKQLGVEMKVINADILNCKEVVDNPSNRCYFCKNQIFGTLKAQALKDGYNVIIDGSNASDDAKDRPGMKAIAELEVMSPLRLCNLTKDEIRKLSKEAKLFTWNKPAYACLATRIPTGHVISKELLDCVEKSEDILFKLGYSDFRVRVYYDAARLQFKAEDMEGALKDREKICQELKTYFKVVLLDLEGR